MEEPLDTAEDEGLLTQLGCEVYNTETHMVKPFHPSLRSSFGGASTSGGMFSGDYSFGDDSNWWMASLQSTSSESSSSSSSSEAASEGSSSNKADGSDGGDNTSAGYAKEHDADYEPSEFVKEAAKRRKQRKDEKGRRDPRDLVDRSKNIRCVTFNKIIGNKAQPGSQQGKQSSSSSSTSSSSSSSTSIALGRVLMNVLNVTEKAMGRPVSVTCSINLNTTPWELWLLELRPLEIDVSGDVSVGLRHQMGQIMEDLFNISVDEPNADLLASSSSLGGACAAIQPLQAEKLLSACKKQPVNRIERLLVNSNPLFSLYTHRVLCAASTVLGAPSISPPIFDLVFIDPWRFDKTATVDAAREMAIVNKMFSSASSSSAAAAACAADGSARNDSPLCHSASSQQPSPSTPSMSAEGDSRRGYIVVGLGRWGTSTASLGIPVQWSEINNATCVIETGIARKFEIESSSASHFLHHLIASKKAWMFADPACLQPSTVSASSLSAAIDCSEGKRGRQGFRVGMDWFDWAWVKRQMVKHTMFYGKHVVCLRLDKMASAEKQKEMCHVLEQKEYKSPITAFEIEMMNFLGKNGEGAENSDAKNVSDKTETVEGCEKEEKVEEKEEDDDPSCLRIIVDPTNMRGRVMIDSQSMPLPSVSIFTVQNSIPLQSPQNNIQKLAAKESSTSHLLISSSDSLTPHTFTRPARTSAKTRSCAVPKPYAQSAKGEYETNTQSLIIINPDDESTSHEGNVPSRKMRDSDECSVESMESREERGRKSSTRTESMDDIIQTVDDDDDDLDSDTDTDIDDDRSAALTQSFDGSFSSCPNSLLEMKRSSLNRMAPAPTIDAAAITATAGSADNFIGSDKSDTQPVPLPLFSMPKPRESTKPQLQSLSLSLNSISNKPVPLPPKPPSLLRLSSPAIKKSSSNPSCHSSASPPAIAAGCSSIASPSYQSNSALIPPTSNESAQSVNQTKPHASTSPLQLLLPQPDSVTIATSASASQVTPVVVVSPATPTSSFSQSSLLFSQDTVPDDIPSVVSSSLEVQHHQM